MRMQDEVDEVDMFNKLLLYATGHVAVLSVEEGKLLQISNISHRGPCGV